MHVRTFYPSLWSGLRRLLRLHQGCSCDANYRLVRTAGGKVFCESHRPTSRRFIIPVFVCGLALFLAVAIGAVVLIMRRVRRVEYILGPDKSAPPGVLPCFPSCPRLRMSPAI